MTQHELIIEYIKEHGSFTPAKMSGYIYRDNMIGSQCDKRCRELRAQGKLISHKEGRFEVYCLPHQTSYQELEKRTEEELNEILRTRMQNIPTKNLMEDGELRERYFKLDDALRAKNKHKKILAIKNT